jgi:hypothetical protein
VKSERKWEILDLNNLRLSLWAYMSIKIHSYMHMSVMLTFWLRTETVTIEGSSWNDGIKNLFYVHDVTIVPAMQFISKCFHIHAIQIRVNGNQFLSYL